MATTNVLANSSKYNLYKYKVNIRFIRNDAALPEDEFQLSKALTKLVIHKNFDDFIYPYYKAVFQLSVEQVKFLTVNHHAGKIYISIEKFLIKIEKDATTETPTGEFYIKDIPFAVFEIDKNPTDAIEPEVPSKRSESNAGQKAIPFTLGLIPSVPMDINKYINNGAFHDTALPNVLAYLVGVNSPKFPNYKFFVSNIDNVKVYETIIVPPFNFNKAVVYVDSCYGLYKTKLLQFFDCNEAYVMSANRLFKNEKYKYQLVALEMMGPEALASLTDASYKSDEDSVWFLRTRQKPILENSNKLMREIGGESVKFVGSSQEENTAVDCGPVKIDKDETNSERSKEIVVKKMYDNDFIMSKYNGNLQENSAKFTAVWDDCDIETFQSYFEYTVLSNSSYSKDYEGYWRLTCVEHTFNKVMNVDELAIVYSVGMFRPAVKAE